MPTETTSDKIDELQKILSFGEDVNNKISRLQGALLQLAFLEWTILISSLGAAALGLFFSDTYIWLMRPVPTQWVLWPLSALGFVLLTVLTLRENNIRRNLKIEYDIMNKLVAIVTSLYTAIPEMDSVTRAVLAMRMSRLEFGKYGGDGPPKSFYNMKD